MIAISNSSPMIALSRVDRLQVLKQLFGNVVIPRAVYEEVVLESNIPFQRENILKAIDDFITVLEPQTNHSFSRNLGKGERGVLNLALEKKPEVLIIDDKKARNEAKSLGFVPFFTNDVLRLAEKRGLIVSYQQVTQELNRIGIFLPA